MARICTIHALTWLALFFFLTSSASSLGQEGIRMARTLSSSERFVVYSNDASRRGTLARRAEEIRSEWVRQLPDPGDKFCVILIRDLIGPARYRGNLPLATSVYEGDGGTPKIQIDIYDTAALQGHLFDKEILRALGLERVYRNTPVKAGKAIRFPSPWIIEGFAEEVRIREEGSSSSVYTALLSSGRPPKLDEFLKTKPEQLEATSLALYRTQAMALLRTLEQLPEGRRGIASLLEAVEEGTNIKTILATYPSLKNDFSRLVKLWTLSIARASAGNRIDLLSIDETEQALSTILAVTTDANSKKPDNAPKEGPLVLPLVARQEGGAFIMRQKSSELLNLEFRCHPLFRPIIEEYRHIVTLLAKKPKKNVDKRIEENEKIRSLLQERGRLLNDYMNWFEATQLDTFSGNFLDISKPISSPKRTDPITRYLDAIEQHGW